MEDSKRIGNAMELIHEIKRDIEIKKEDKLDCLTIGLVEYYIGAIESKLRG